MSRWNHRTLIWMPFWLFTGFMFVVHPAEQSTRTIVLGGGLESFEWYWASPLDQYAGWFVLAAFVLSIVAHWFLGPSRKQRQRHASH